MTDLLALVAELVDIPSVSHDEAAIAGFVESELRACGLEVERLGDNVVARTTLGRAGRVVLAGHLDTVPPAGNERARIEGDICHGLGSVDMKGGVAVLLALARELVEPVYDLTYVFYACEEVERRYSGLEPPWTRRAPTCSPGTPRCCSSRPGEPWRRVARV